METLSFQTFDCLRTLTIRDDVLYTEQHSKGICKFLDAMKNIPSLQIVRMEGFSDCRCASRHVISNFTMPEMHTLELRGDLLACAELLRRVTTPHLASLTVRAADRGIYEQPHDGTQHFDVTVTIVNAVRDVVSKRKKLEFLSKLVLAHIYS